MHLLDSAFIFVLALVLFGPKKLPEIARQMGKLLAEFRRASNDFKMQMDEELRSMEQQEQQKKLAEAATPSQVPSPDGASMLTILPPTEGEQVPIASPYAEAMAAEETAAAESAVLENVEMESAGFEEYSIGNHLHPAGAEQPETLPEPGLLPETELLPETVTLPESEQAPIHHG